MTRFLFSALLFSSLGVALGFAPSSAAQPRLEMEQRLNDESIYFDGNKVNREVPNNPDGYDYAFGPALVPHGDCITVHEKFVFLTWFRGGKEDRHVMLTRLNRETGSMATIEFPHRHSGWRGNWWIGETHNTIAVGVSPLDGTVHLLYDMHAYSSTRPKDGSFADDYFRYSFSEPGVATVPDAEFTLDRFVKSPDGDFKHLALDGHESEAVWGDLTYPKFFLNDQGNLFVFMRHGASSNGKYVVSRYDGEAGWTHPFDFHKGNAKRNGLEFNYGVYGRMKYADGKIRVGFQKRSSDKEDRYLYQNGIYYAVSAHPSGQEGWTNHRGESFEIPLLDPAIIKVFEPGDLVESTKKDQVYMVGQFDFNVTERGDEHFIARVIDREHDVTQNVHVFRAAGEDEFEFTTDFGGGSSLYASGDSILLISLQNGRPLIQRTEGGTHNWKTIYAPDSGLVFDKGVPYIHEGKLYYYLKVPGTGDKRTTYLQVIDLDLDLDLEPDAG